MGDVGRADCGVIRDQADEFEVDVLRRCDPPSERCQGVEDGVEGVMYVVGEFGFVGFAAGKEVVSICVGSAAEGAGLGRGGRKWKAERRDGIRCWG